MGTVFRMHVMAADYGDCLWIEYGSAAAPHRILVDAGTPATFGRLAPRLAAVQGADPSHELFVVTHVDEDHIGGSLKVLADPDLAKQFRHIWFNGRRHLVAASQEEDFGPAQGEKLTSSILQQRMAWNEHFDGAQIARAADGSPMVVELPGGATATILTPSQERLAKLLPVWDTAIAAAGLVPGQDSVPETLAEGEESFGLDVEQLADVKSKGDKAPANGSSIAILLEFHGKRLLLGADAHPDDLLAGIMALTGGSPLKVDVFKLPHHGSKNNVTDDLLRLIEADVVVFSSNGQRFEHPDREAVARVVRRYKGKAKLVFNYDSEFTRIWADQQLRQQWKYQVEYGHGEQGVHVALL